jgi:hypothetical protein
MTGKGEKVVMLFGQRNRWRVSSICMIISSLSGFSILAGTICKQTAWNMLLDLVCKQNKTDKDHAGPLHGKASIINQTNTV